MSNDSSKDTILSSPTKKVPWNPWLGFSFGVLVFVGAQITAGILVAFYPVVRGWSSQQANTWLGTALAAQLAYLALFTFMTISGILMFAKGYDKQGFARLGLKKPQWIDPLRGVIAFPVYYLFLIVAVLIAKLLVPALDVNQVQDLGFNEKYVAYQLVLIFVGLVILAPITEELLFRGLIYSSLKKAMPLWGAIIVTSGLFAAGHLAEGGSSGPLYIAAIDTFILSLVLIYLREKTGSLWASMTLHALKNAVAFIYLFLWPIH